MGPKGDAVVGAGAGMVAGVDTDGGADMDDGAGTGAESTAAVGMGVAADAGDEDGAVAETEGFVCLDADKGAD